MTGKGTTTGNGTPTHKSKLFDEHTISCVKQNIERIVESFGIHKRFSSGTEIYYDCPFCGSGTKDKRTPAFSVNPVKQAWQCKSCHACGSAIDFIIEKTGMSFPESVKYACCEILHIPVFDDDGAPVVYRTPQKEMEHRINEHNKDRFESGEKLKLLIPPLLNDCINARQCDDFVCYAQDVRGLTPETIERFNIGYLSAEVYNAHKTDLNTLGIRDYHIPAIVIPYPGKKYFFMRLTTNDKTKVNNKVKPAGLPCCLFNAPALKDHDCIFVCDGQIDALCIEQCGFPAIATGGATSRAIIDEIKQYATTPVKKTLCLCVDNDERKPDQDKSPGEMWADKLTEALQDDFNIQRFLIGINPDEKIADGTIKDINDLMIEKGSAYLTGRLAEVDAADENERAKAEMIAAGNDPEAKPESAPGFDCHWFDDCFVDRLIDFQRNAISTGIPPVDNAMNGGLTPQLYIIGALPSMGKSTLCLQIADNIARSGTPVLYFSAEMSKEHLMFKTLSRMAYEYCAGADYLAGRRYSTEKDPATHCFSFKTLRNLAPEQQDTLKHVSQLFNQTIGQKRAIIDLSIIRDMTIDTIEAKINDYVKQHGKSVVFIDYLQLIATGGDDPKQSLDTVIKRLKHISQRESIPIVLISSFNRSAYKSPSLDAGSGSGNIEYSADEYYFLLPAKSYGSENDDLLVKADACKRDKTGMKLIFRCLKSRMFGLADDQGLVLNAEYSLFRGYSSSDISMPAKPKEKEVW